MDKILMNGVNDLMNISYINPFIEATSNVFKQTTGIEVSIGKLYLKPPTYNVSGVIIVVGVVGAIKGKAVLFFDNDFACKVASAMMMGMPVNELDDLSKSALSELANMILGNTATVFYKNGYKIDITPPSILTGSNIEITSDKQQTICIPLVTENNVSLMELSVAFVEA
ncbi:MAG: chemotaxis protein CheX [Bacillota bacterium]|nr:chemotaxis protein CheX [Bacillota bacterium]